MGKYFKIFNNNRMKKVMIYLMLVALFGACNKGMDDLNKKEEPVEEKTLEEEPSPKPAEGELEYKLDNEGFGKHRTVLISLVDEELNDRLNPDSPSYFGDVFIKGIELLVLCNGEKITCFEFYTEHLGREYDPERRFIKLGFNEYFFHLIDCTTGIFSPLLVYEEDRICTYTYLSYPDGSEDEIKIQLEGNYRWYIEFIWINNEVAFVRSEDTTNKVYYNPKYFPFFSVISAFDGSNAALVPSVPSVVTITKPR